MITIFTPTYNRANIIRRTYESLCNQSCKDFEWLVVNDGSTDNTEMLFEQWTKEAPFPIRHIKKTNEGKYKAYNVGLREAKGEFFFCVDSDDWLPQNSIERILQHRNLLFSNPKLAGITALKEYPNKKIIGEKYTKGLGLHSLYSLEQMGEGGERSLIFKTDIAKQFPFPEETNEKFMTESVIYDCYEGKYDFFVTNDVLTTCEYQQEGLSGNPRILMLNNPAGYKLYFAQRIDLGTSLISRIKMSLSYHAFRLLCDKSIFPYRGKHKSLVTLLAPLGYIMKRYYCNSIS